MVRYVLLAVAFLIFLSVAAALLVAAVVTLVLATAVGIPLYLMARPHLERHGLAQRKQLPMERLQSLFAEGKIEMHEFERRVARLIAVEH